MEWWYWAVLIGANTPVYVLIGWLIFDDLAGFIESLRYWMMPDAWSWIKGEGIEDLWAELKLFAFVIACTAIVAGEHYELKAEGVWRWDRRAGRA